MMRAEDMIPRAIDMLPDRDALAGAIGWRRESSMMRDTASTVMTFAAGAIVGSALALLFAPRRGEELRADLRHKVDDIRGRATDKANEAAEKGKRVLTEM